MGTIRFHGWQSPIFCSFVSWNPAAKRMTEKSRTEELIKKVFRPGAYTVRTD